MASTDKHAASIDDADRHSTVTSTQDRGPSKPPAVPQPPSDCWSVDCSDNPLVAKYRANHSKLQPVMNVVPMPFNPSASFIDMKGASPSPVPVPKTVAKTSPTPRMEPSERPSSNTSGKSNAEALTDLSQSASVSINRISPLSSARKEQKATLSKTVAKMLAGSSGKTSHKITTEDISKPRFEEEVATSSRTEETHYPLRPLGTAGEGSGSSNYSTPSLDFQQTSASDSSPATSFIDMSDPGHDVYRHKPSGSVDSVARNWKSRLMGNKGQAKGDDVPTNNQNGPQRSVSLRAKLGGKASPRPSLDRSHSNHPSLDLKVSSNLAHDSSPPSTRSTYAISTADPFARPPPPHASTTLVSPPEQKEKIDVDNAQPPFPHTYTTPALSPEELGKMDVHNIQPPLPRGYTAPVLSPEDLGKVDARFARLPEGYEERMKAAPRPKGRRDAHDPLGPYKVSEPSSVQLPPHMEQQLAREADIAKRELERERNAANEKEPAKLLKEKKEKKEKKADKEKLKASGEEGKVKNVREGKSQTRDKGRTRDSKDEAKARERGKEASTDTKHQRSGSTLLKKKAVDSKGSATAQMKTSGPSKPTKERANIPPPLALHHDNFNTSRGYPYGTASSSRQTLDVNDIIVLKPFTPPPLPRPFTPEEGIEGAMCLTMDDFDFESEVEKPPPLPPKDRGKLVRSKTTSSKATAKAASIRKPLRRLESFETTMSVYSQPSFCEDEGFDLVITPRQPTGRM